MEATEWNYLRRTNSDKVENGIVPQGMELRKLVCFDVWLWFLVLRREIGQPVGTEVSERNEAGYRSLEYRQQSLETEFYLDLANSR